MSKKETDVVVEATYARNVLTRFDRIEEPSAKASKAAEELRKALETVQAKREALESAMR